MLKDLARLVLARRPKMRLPVRKLPCALTAWRLLLPRKPGKVRGHIERFLGPRATTLKSVTKLSSLSRSRRRNMRSVIRKKVRMLLAVRAEVVK